MNRSLQFQLTALALIVTIPFIMVITIFLTIQARSGLIDAANKTLSTANGSISQSTSLWLDYNTRALKTMVSNPNIIAMNSIWQKPILKEMVAAYPSVYLVSTLDVNGVNKTRSDAQPFEISRDRYWFQNAFNGAPVTYETVVSPKNDQPALVISMPIQREDGTVVGVGMLATELDQINELIHGVRLGQTGSLLVLDQRDNLIIHSDPDARLLANLSGNPAVEALRAGISGNFVYTDYQGERIQANISQLPNGWGVIVQQSEAGLFEPIRRFQQIAFTALVIVAALMTVLLWSAIRQALRPVQDLTETAIAISQGDLTRQADVRPQKRRWVIIGRRSAEPDQGDGTVAKFEQSKNELDILSHAFNEMTAQLRELISDLENRVIERTRALEQRATQFLVTAEVAREAASIHKPEILLQDVVELISDRFGFDHAGIFLLETESKEYPGEIAETAPESGGTKELSNERKLGAGSREQERYAILRAASSEGGLQMLKRGHRLRIGREGIVGYVAATGQPRIALDVGSDAVFFNNPDLPLTRSEMALPLKVQNQVIGVLDVQSNRPSAFSEEDVSILQILADQVALAIENARLLSETQQAIQELESLYGQQIRQGWGKRLANQPLVYTFDQRGVLRSQPNMEQAADTGPLNSSKPADFRKTSFSPQDTLAEVMAPIELRGVRIGALRLRRSARRAAWSEAEKELIHETVAQLALSLENARLMEEIRIKAWQEELINQVVARTQGSLDLDTVMKTAVTEIGRTMKLAKVQIRLQQDLKEVEQADLSLNESRGGNGYSRSNDNA